MTKVIEKLTPEQWASLPHYQKKWTDIGLSTEPLNFEKAKECATKAYEAVGLTPPTEWYHFRSPMECAVEMAKKEFGDNPTTDQIQEHINAQVYGCHDAGWLSFYNFFLDTGLEVCEPLVPIMELAKYCGWWAPYDTACALQDRPSEIHLDDQNLMHNETGPAIIYPDGYSVYGWHGTRVPREWIEDPENSLTPEVALYWENTEQRRAACEIIGWDKILEILNANVIDENENPEIGTLLEVNHENISGSTEKFLRVRCGTGRTFAIPVPPHVSTALEANAWTYNIAANDYDIEVRT
jgi:hypothetical protein